MLGERCVELSSFVPTAPTPVALPSPQAPHNTGRSFYLWEDGRVLLFGAAGRSRDWHQAAGRRSPRLRGVPGASDFDFAKTQGVSQYG
jgi:hypothetical protein